MYHNSTGSYNTAIGSSSLYDNTTGSNNTAIGYNTARGITTGVANTILGANVTGLAASLSNNIIIADGDGNQRINVTASGYVGIGTTTPIGILDLVSGSGRLIVGNIVAGAGPQMAYLPTITLQSTQNTGPYGWTGSTRFTYDNNGFVISHNGGTGGPLSAPPGFGLGTMGRNGDIYIDGTGSVGI